MDSKSYEAVVRDATAIADLFLDIENGRWMLAILCSFLQLLLDEGELNAAVLLHEELFGIVDTPYEECDEESLIELLYAFIEVLEERLL